jgi:hypothetical protein
LLWEKITSLASFLRITSLQSLGRMPCCLGDVCLAAKGDVCLAAKGDVCLATNGDVCLAIQRNSWLGSLEDSSSLAPLRKNNSLALLRMTYSLAPQGQLSLAPKKRIFAWILRSIKLGCPRLRASISSGRASSESQPFCCGNVSAENVSFLQVEIEILHLQ